MKVLFCLSHIEKSLQWSWFADELQERGIKQVYVLINTNQRSENYFYNDLLKLGVEVYVLQHNGKLSYIKNLLQTRSIIKKHKPDIIHTSLPLGNLVGQSAAWLSGISHRVTTCENVSWAHDFKNKKQEWIDNYTFRRSKRIIATSEIAADYLRKNWDFDKSKLNIIYHGLKFSDYEISGDRIELLKNKLRIDKSRDFIVGIIARFEYWKGHEFIIEAARILKGHPEIKFFIFGSKGSYYKEALKKIEQYDLGRHIIYGGFVEDTSALYQLFDVHLHVPVNEYVETGGITIIEGMIAGRPQVLTLSGYAWQSAKHIHNAFVVPFKNAAAISDAILWVKNNPEKARQMGDQAKKDALVFSVQNKAIQHIELYKELLK